MAVSSNALVDETAPRAFQVSASVENCQAPPPLAPTIAMPLAAPVSTSAQAAPARSALTAAGAEAVFSTADASARLAPLVMVGASLSGVMSRLAEPAAVRLPSVTV